MVRLRIEGAGAGEKTREILRRLGDKASGVWLEAIQDSSGVAGYRLVGASRSAVLAHVSGLSLFRAGRFKVNVESLETVAVRTIREALRNPRVTCIVIDGINRMTLFSEKFREAVRDALSSDRSVVISLQDGPHGFVDFIKSRTEAVSTVEEALRRLSES